MSGERRPATPAEAKALAHPVRQRIIRLCTLGERTNQQLADELGRDPATILYHVRQLVATGFLTPGEVRAGASGALEKPYRATGKSWQLDADPTQVGDATLALIDAVREEVAAAGPTAVVASTRFVVRLPEPELRTWLVDLQAQIDALVERSEPGAVGQGAPPAHAVSFVVHRIPELPRGEPPDADG